MIPDMKRVLSDYLRAEGFRAVGKDPDDTDIAWVKVIQINAPQDANLPVDYLVDFQIQMDCYAGISGGIPEAHTLALEVRQAVTEMDQADHSGAEVTAARITGDFEVLDEDYTPARARWVVNATITAHALEAVS